MPQENEIHLGRDESARPIFNSIRHAVNFLKNKEIITELKGLDYKYVIRPVNVKALVDGSKALEAFKYLRDRGQISIFDNLQGYVCYYVEETQDQALKRIEKEKAIAEKAPIINAYNYEYDNSFIKFNMVSTGDYNILSANNILSGSSDYYSSSETSIQKKSTFVDDYYFKKLKKIFKDTGNDF